MRVVVVDDDEDVRLILRAMLAERHDVTEFPDARDAKAGADWKRTDVVVCDALMPTPGDTLLEWLDVTYPHVRRVVCTALDTSVLKSEYAHLGHEIVLKPFDYETLDRAIHGRTIHG